MASYAPMPYSPYSPPMPYSQPMAYSAPMPMSFADTPLVVPDDTEDLSGGGGRMVTKFLALPPIILLPILLPVVVVVVAVVAAVVVAVVAAVTAKNTPNVGSGGKENYDNNTPYYDDNSYGNDYQDNYNNNRPNNSSNRKRRQTEKNKKMSPSTALPSMSIAQVDRLTQVVFAAINSQECVQRLLCEVGSLSRSFSDAETVTKAVKDYVPEKLKDSFNIFAKAEKCEQYKCGSLKVKN